MAVDGFTKSLAMDPFRKFFGDKLAYPDRCFGFFFFFFFMEKGLLNEFEGAC
jgi:hypothetical protein